MKSNVSKLVKNGWRHTPVVVVKYGIEELTPDIKKIKDELENIKKALIKFERYENERRKRQ